MSDLTNWAEAEVQRRLELRTKAINLQPVSGSQGWWPLFVREPYPGAWQRNDELQAQTALSFSAVFACHTLIIGDIGKVNLNLVIEDENGIWTPTENPAYSPVLRRPNHYQNWTQFIECWVSSKLNTGNAYVLKERDARRVVVAMYVLDPNRVKPLVAFDRSVYYELRRDDLSGQPQDNVTVPASEIIHDRFNCLFHPLVGLSPVFACAVATRQGLSIQGNSQKMFANGSFPGGILTAPGAIEDETAARIKAYWQTEFSGDNVGNIAVLGDDLKYQQLAFNAVDMQLIDQLKWTGETVCSCYHVPPYLVDIGPPPPYANVEPVIQKYHAQCLQTQFIQIERALDDGLGLGREFGNRYGTEFDPDDLIWMDAAAKSKAAQDGIGGGGMSFNEARKRYHGLGPVAGGETPLTQEQYWPLEALIEAKKLALQALANPPRPAPTAPAAQDEEDDDDEPIERAAAMSALHRKAVEHGLYVA